MARTIFALGRLRLVLGDTVAVRRIEHQVRRTGLPSIFEPATKWYEPWYFGLRLEEEISRSQRHAFKLAVVGIAIEPTGGPLSPDRIDLGNSLARFASELRQSDLPGVLDSGRLVIALPQTDREGAEIVAHRLHDVLAAQEARIGIAVFPEDAIEGAELLQAAFASTEVAQPKVDTAVGDKYPRKDDGSIVVKAKRKKKASRDESTAP